MDTNIDLVTNVEGTGTTELGSNNNNLSANNGQSVNVPKEKMSKYNKPTQNDNMFLQFYVAMQVAGVLMLGLLFIWILKFYGGFSWSDHIVRFNFHPMLMVLGMIYLAGNSLLVFRVLKNVPKPTVKIVHASIHVSAFLISFIGSIAVFTNHFVDGKPNLYSLHSWIGFTTVLFFFGQYVVAFLSFLYPTASAGTRSFLLPYHVLGGFVIFGLATIASLTGLCEKMAFDVKNYANYSGRMWVLNFIGIFLIVFSMLVFYLGTERSYKRHAIGEQLPLTRTFNANSNSNPPSSPDADAD